MSRPSSLRLESTALANASAPPNRSSVSGWDELHQECCRAGRHPGEVDGENAVIAQEEHGERRRGFDGNDGRRGDATAPHGFLEDAFAFGSRAATGVRVTRSPKRASSATVTLSVVATSSRTRSAR